MKLICTRRTFPRIPGIFRTATFASQVRSAGRPARAAAKAKAAVTTITVFLEDAFI